MFPSSVTSANDGYYMFGSLPPRPPSPVSEQKFDNPEYFTYFPPDPISPAARRQFDGQRRLRLFHGKPHVNDQHVHLRQWSNLLQRHVLSITPNHVIAHLEVLDAFQHFRNEISSPGALFGLLHPDAVPLGVHPPATPSSRPGSAAPTYSTSRPGSTASSYGRKSGRHGKTQDKKWAVFVARAADRFERWWDKCIPSTLGGKPQPRVTIAMLHSCRARLKSKLHRGVPLTDLISPEHLPPLDVLIVWHAYLLNPQRFFEDCVRYGKLDFYVTPFPLFEVANCINRVTLEYEPPAAAVENFERKTGLKWANVDDPWEKTMPCPSCTRPASFPWTENWNWARGANNATDGTGYADQAFRATCGFCGVELSHKYLRAQKFRKDMNNLRVRDYPMAGPLFGSQHFPHQMLRRGRQPFTDFTEILAPQHDETTMINVRLVFDNFLKGPGLRTGGGYVKDQKQVVDLLDRYWYNASPFALDLGASVLRQGIFVKKMHEIDWLHSPTAISTVQRSIIKYERFFGMICSSREKDVAPTLDVDLAWHTHMLNPIAYSAYSHQHAGGLIDHDENIEEHLLNQAFIYTSGKYEGRYGEPYSECLCWYCEAVRESTHRRDNDPVLRRIHSADLPRDGHRAPHLSAHSSVTDLSFKSSERQSQRDQLQEAYEKAVTRARKNNWREPDQGDPDFPLLPYRAKEGAIGQGLYKYDCHYVRSKTGHYGGCIAVVKYHPPPPAYIGPFSS
ncbi:hypothetical protein EJ06DRAFT_381341 [Trichodelitschia bisporula]|uniref:Alpha-ketoglutarate-dependent sulfonate dioxygenase n=1 Tax=Trichodelitschia bisporula TaxID=703511 RepID=A0A6G1HZM7_9PEZI|nr:hypothetical protein EJ06DRAFT_381341 [Trichodelitschia bisporula]